MTTLDFKNSKYVVRDDNNYREFDTLKEAIQFRNSTVIGVKQSCNKQDSSSGQVNIPGSTVPAPRLS